MTYIERETEVSNAIDWRLRQNRIFPSRETYRRDLQQNWSINSVKLLKLIIGLVEEFPKLGEMEIDWCK
jgi:hypothetical protein